MCFTRGEDSPENSLNGYNKHILDVVSNRSEHYIPTQYVTDIALKLDKRLSGPESTLLLRDLFNITYYSRIRTREETDSEKILSTVLYRECDSTMDYSYFKFILRDYINNNIKKTLNLSIREYMELTSYEKVIYDEFALEHAKAVSKEVEKMEKEHELNLKKSGTMDFASGLTGLEDDD